jgi:hypothetical protein
MLTFKSSSIEHASGSAAHAPSLKGCGGDVVEVARSRACQSRRSKTRWETQSKGGTAQGRLSNPLSVAGRNVADFRVCCEKRWLGGTDSLTSQQCSSAVLSIAVIFSVFRGGSTVEVMFTVPLFSFDVMSKDGVLRKEWACFRFGLRNVK